MSTVISSTTEADEGMRDERSRPTSGSPYLVRFHAAASAFHGSPLRNFTPSRRLRRHLSGPICSQPVVAVVGPSVKVGMSRKAKACPMALLTIDPVSALPVCHGDSLSGSTGITALTTSFPLADSAGGEVGSGSAVAAISSAFVGAMPCTSGGVVGSAIAVGAVVGCCGGGSAPPQATANPMMAMQEMTNRNLIPRRWLIIQLLP